MDQEEDHEMSEPTIPDRLPTVKEPTQLLSIKDGRQYLPWVEKYRPTR